MNIVDKGELIEISMSRYEAAALQIMMTCGPNGKYPCPKIDAVVDEFFRIRTEYNAP